MNGIGGDRSALLSVFAPAVRAMSRPPGPDPLSYSLRFEKEGKTGRVITEVFGADGKLIRVIPLDRMTGMIVSKTL